MRVIGKSLDYGWIGLQYTLANSIRVRLAELPSALAT